MKDSSAILEINTKNILHNYKALSRIASNSISGATIKANAYGLGDIKVFNILYNNGCRHFFVATIEEEPPSLFNEDNWNPQKPVLSGM